MPEWLTSRRTYLVGGIVVVVLGIVVVLVRTSWTLLGWTALAALAASLQAVGVIGALAFVSAQINSARAESRRQRGDQLIDELGTATFRTLAPAVGRHISAWRTVLYFKESAANFGETELGKEYAGLYHQRRTEVPESGSEVHAAIEDVRLVLLRLGEEEKTEFAGLHVAAICTPAYLLPIKPIEPLVHDYGDDFIERLGDAATTFEQWVRDYIRQHVSSE
jgi:hypothetical protein